MAPTQVDSLVLRRSLEKLPQELYDMIYGFTFTAKPGIRQLGTAISGLKGMTPPADAIPHQHLFHVDRSSRAKYAAAYYGAGSIFVLYDLPTLLSWLRTLPEAHHPLIADIRCITRRGCMPLGSQASRIQEADRRRMKKALADAGVAQDLAAKVQCGWESEVTSGLDEYTSRALVQLP